MSELKVYRDQEDYIAYDDYLLEAYNKDEADAVIAELKAQKAQAEDDCAYWKTMSRKRADDNEVMAKQRAEAFRRESHHKYKRCLAMAKWCEMCHRELLTRACLPTKQNWNRHDEWRYFVNFWHRYEYRFRKLAEKFKEAK